MNKLVDPYVPKENLFDELASKINTLLQKIELMQKVKPSTGLDQAHSCLKNCLEKVHAQQLSLENETITFKKNYFTSDNRTRFFSLIDSTIEKGGWNGSNFLIQIGHQFKMACDDFKKNWDAQTKEEITFQYSCAHQDLPDMQKVYIALYSSKGGDIAAWESILANLSMNFISRPVYDDEEKITMVLRNSEFVENVAYIAIFVKKSSFLELPPDKIPVDRLGNVLLSLKNNTLILNNIDYFSYKSQLYRYIKGRLVPY